MTMTHTTPASNRVRYFPSGIALVAAAELVLIALLLCLSNSPVFFAAAIACALCSIQLGVLLIGRFRINTLNVRKLARQAEFSTNLVLITDAQGRIKWTNSCFSRITGFNLSEIVGKTFSMVLHGQDTQTLEVEKIRKKLRLAQPFEADLLQYDRNGNKLWVSTHGQPVCDARQQVTHYLITQIDHTDQHRQAEKVRELTETNRSKTQTIAIGDGVELVRKFADLSARDDREVLEKLVAGLKVDFDQCLADLPAFTTQLKATHPND